MSLTVLAARPSSIEIGWSAPANFSSVCCFQILHDGVVEYQADRADRSATLHGVVPQSRHCFRVRAMSSGFPLMGLFMVAESNTVCVDVPVNSPPTVPQDVEATVLSPARVDLRWSPSTDEEAVAGDHQVARLEVAVDHRRHAAVEVDQDLEGAAEVGLELLEREALAGVDDVGEGPALDVLLDEGEAAALAVEDGVDVARDRRVIERAQRFQESQSGDEIGLKIVPRGLH